MTRAEAIRALRRLRTLGLGGLVMEGAEIHRTGEEPAVDGRLREVEVWGDGAITGWYRAPGSDVDVRLRVEPAPRVRGQERLRP